MALIFELQTTSTQKYIKNYIISIIREFNINAKVTQSGGKIVCAFTSEHKRLQECLEAIAQRLPASIFLKSSKSYESDENIESLPDFTELYPLNLGLCPTCQKEMFDVSSRRYYYPFTSCKCCGGNYSFFNSYPYKRENTSFKYLHTCKDCEDEKNNRGLRENHHIISCNSCPVPIRLIDKKSERYANDAGSYRTMFEVAAKAILDNKSLLIKTTMGFRLFYNINKIDNNSILMMINAAKITEHLALITEEFNALLSIEKPLLHVSISSEKLKEIFNANTAYVKYPDDGFSILLASELQKLGLDFIAYEDVDENSKADIVMEYDLEINPQSEIRFFINKDTKFIAEGERVSFPSYNLKSNKTLSIAHNLVAMDRDANLLIDSMQKFDSIEIDRVNVLENDTHTYHSKQLKMAQDEASFISVIAEHNIFDKKCVGVYFNDEPTFLYYNTKSVVRIIPPVHFQSKEILSHIQDLRDGSERLVQNLQHKMPEVYKKLQNLQDRDDVKLFEAVSIILGLKDESMRGLSKEAMKFIGKGGIQIDTHIKDNRFDYAAFLASIISYQLAGVSSVILSYSIFESFGDYFSEIVQELKSKTDSTEIILCGTHFANQSLFSRMQNNLKMTPPLMNINYPIGKENAVVGGAYL